MGLFLLQGLCVALPSAWDALLVDPKLSRVWRQSKHTEINASTSSVVVQSLSCVQLYATPWTAAHQASLPFTISHSLLKLMSIELVMPLNHLILCGPLLLLPSISPSIRVFETALRIR